ncbi:flagellar hook-basal body complex protein FliE [Chromatiaceae bacterium AAb-1]|jgi:flagellar hook-basal body complex protein FliE|nr:flagellar hook-basal body complex protein FliE [Chromatiaceae bacterium AAb-1]
MNIKSQALYAEMQSLAGQARSIANDIPLKKSQELNLINPSQSDFSTMLKDALGNVNNLQQETSQLRNRLEMGDNSVSLAQVMISAQKSSLAFEATVQVRNKLVEAYKEIMSMPV